MICTEKEAAEKWCPQVRFVPVTKNKALSPANRFACDDDAEPESNPDWSRCIGSRCMMWEWAESDTYQRVSDGKFDTIPQEMRAGTCGLINRSAS